VARDTDHWQVLMNVRGGQRCPNFLGSRRPYGAPRPKRNT
jgi:hypothetical protein